MMGKLRKIRLRWAATEAATYPFQLGMVQGALDRPAQGWCAGILAPWWFDGLLGLLHP